MSPAPVRAPGVLDVAAGVSLVLVSVAIVGLPPASTDLQVSPSSAGAAIAAAVLGAMGLVGCWIAASLRSRRVPVGVMLLVAGIALWAVMLLVAEPSLGWRLGVVTVGLVSELLVAIGWFVLRGYPPVAYVALLALVAGAAVVALAPTLTVVLVGLLGGPLVAFAVALPVLRAQAPSASR